VIRVAFVTGSRTFGNYAAVWDWLWSQAQLAVNRHDDALVVMHGACPTGADHWAHVWAQQRGAERQPALRIYEQADPALWDSVWRKRAGPLRNMRQAQRLAGYRLDGGVDIHIAVCHHATELAAVVGVGGTGNQVEHLIQVGFRLDEMTYLEET